LKAAHLLKADFSYSAQAGEEAHALLSQQKCSIDACSDLVCFGFLLNLFLLAHSN